MYQKYKARILLDIEAQTTKLLRQRRGKVRKYLPAPDHMTRHFCVGTRISVGRSSQGHVT